MQPHFKEKFESLRQGHHACLFYDHADVSRVITVEFIKMGLKKNEQCLYFADPLAVQRVIMGLGAAGVDVEHEVGRGALVLTSDREYLIDGHFNADHLIKLLSECIERALKTGFTGVRATGDVIWELGPNADMERLSDYECLLDKFFAGKKLTGLCQYNCNLVSSENLRQALACHNAIVYDEVVFLNNTFHSK